MNPQGTEGWKLDRAGNVTASQIANVRMKPKKDGSECVGRRNYKAQIVAEILSGKPCESSFFSPDMLRGQELEQYARAAYEVREGALVKEVGFIKHPTIKRAGCSPDGLVGDEGLVEIKAPKTAIHIEYLLADEVPADYRPQLIWQLAVTRREWVDFISYNEELPQYLQLFVKRFQAEQSVIEDFEKDVRQFLSEVDDLLTALDALDKVTACP
jgi:hypothetical protein